RRRLNGMADLVSPHGGGPLKALMLEGDALVAERARAASLRKVAVSSREKGDIIMLGIGGFSPLDGFMSRADWEGVCRDYRTGAGIFWPIPITLSVDAAAAEAIRIGDSITLVDHDDAEPLGWSRVAACQTRNPMHRSHEYLAKIAIEVCDGVLVHSLLGNLKPGDIPADVRIKAIAVLIEKYFRRGTVVQAGYPLDMRYAG